MTTFTFIGCSLTVGEGLEREKHDANNYANIISSHFDAQSNNLAKGGNSNYNIFMSALNELLYSRSSKIFIQWSALNRLWLYPGPDTEIFLSHTIEKDYNYRDLFFSKKKLQNLSNIYHLLNHDYHNIIELINYSNVLEAITPPDKQIIFINGMIPWTKELCDKSTANNYATNLSQYAKEILEFDTRDDSELNKFFFNLSDKINSLQHNKWANMFDSFMKLQIDIGNDIGQHPGPLSHKLYASTIINYLTNLHND